MNHEYASASPCSVRKVGSSQTLHNVCGNWVLRAAGNEATLHCVLLNWQAWVVSRNLRNLPTYATGPNFVNEICSRGLHYIATRRWSKFFRGSPYFAVTFRRVLIFRKISYGGNQFWGVHFYHDMYFSSAVSRGTGLFSSFTRLLQAVSTAMVTIIASHTWLHSIW